MSVVVEVVDTVSLEVASEVNLGFEEGTFYWGVDLESTYCSFLHLL